MSKKACIIFSIWTSFFSALFYHIYGLLPGIAESTFGYSAFIPCGWIMFVHIYLLEKTPFRQMPFIFAGVCLTFSQGGTNEPALITTFIFGLVLCVICTFMLGYATKKWPR